MYYKYNLISLLITIGILLQSIGTLNASESEQYNCAVNEKKYSTLCKQENPQVMSRNFKEACCNSFQVEHCMLTKMPEQCRETLKERYDNDPLKKGACKTFVGHCENH